MIGFAIVLHEPEIGFCYLDFLAAGKDVPGRGIGAALYEYVRDEAVGLGVQGSSSNVCRMTRTAVPTRRLAKSMPLG